MDQPDAILIDGFSQTNVDASVRRCVHYFPDKICVDGEFPMSAVDEDRKLDPPGPTQGVEGFQRGTNGSTVKQDVVNQKDGTVRQVTGNFGRPDFRDAMPFEVVAMHGDVESSHGYRPTEDFIEERAEPTKDFDAATLDSEEDKTVAREVVLGNFMSHSVKGLAEHLSTQHQIAHVVP